MKKNNPYSTPKTPVSSQATDVAYQPVFWAFHGRIGRLRYLAYSLMTYVALFVIGMGLLLIAYATGIALIAQLTVYPAVLTAIGFSFVLMKRRFNDMNKPSWFVILGLIPFVNLGVYIWLMAGSGTHTYNDFGAQPNDNPIIIKVAGFAMLVLLLLLIVAGVFLPEITV